MTLRRTGCWLTGTLAACALGLAVAHGQAQLPEPETPPTLELRLERGLSELSYERLADGSAAAQPAPSPVTEAFTEEPTVSRPFSTLPALLLGGALLALASFAAGVLTVRRRPVVVRDTNAPVQLWTDSEALDKEVETLREQLAEQQLLNESLQADRDAREEELDALRQQRDEAAGESQILRMRTDDDELNRAHETIDELRVEVERLRGAEADLERDPHRFPGGEPELRAELEARDLHIHELEQVMNTVRTERDSFEQSVAGRDAQIQALEQTLDHRDEEIELLQGKLRSAGEQSGAAAEERIRALSDELEAVRDNSVREIGGLQDQLNERHQAEERAEELQQRNQQLENELGERRDELIQLAEQNDRLKAHMRDLELALKRDEDLTTRLELGSLQVGDDVGGIGQAPGAQAALAQAQQRVEELDNELREAKQQIEQLAGDSDDADLQRQNVKLSAMVLQRDNMVAELEAKLAPLQGDPQQSQEWTSTVSSLESELRRKTTVIDGQADDLREGEHRLDEMHSQIAGLNEQLDRTRDESESLKALLAEEQANKNTLREELERAKHAGTQAHGAQRPEQGWYSQPVAADADIETLGRTVRGRQDLVNSLQTILEEQDAALTAARKRASERADSLVSLENEIASNRITIAALQNRVSHAQEHGDAAPSAETQRLERELQRGARMIEKLRTDLHKWRGRVRPLHEAVMMRDNRIKSLDARLRALRDAGFDSLVPAPRAETGADTESEQLEKDKYFQIIAELHEGIERLENELAQTGLELSRVQATDENQVLEIESLEAARAAQLLRIDELHHELVNLGVNPELPGADADNVVELQAHRPDHR